MTNYAELIGVEEVIEDEILQGLTQTDVAKSYALGLRSTWPTDWARVNAAILKRWPKGLERIKKMAWSGKCFEVELPEWREAEVAG